ncbi:MAG: hypothetical protein ACJARD_001480 [Alphaproteobacteria bacterium]|jgi:hypothetical protein
MGHLLKIILTFFIICILGFSTIAGAALCNMNSSDQISDQQVMLDCHNMQQTSDNKIPQKYSCDHCFHCMQSVVMEMMPYQITALQAVQYISTVTSFTTYFHTLESPPPTR